MLVNQRKQRVKRRSLATFSSRLICQVLRICIKELAVAQERVARRRKSTQGNKVIFHSLIYLST